MRVQFFLFFIIISGSIFSQDLPTRIEEADSSMVQLAVGDSMEIGTCSGEFFTHLDYFRKTRWAGGEEAYDTATGEGFYHSFFSSGDFNATELPKSFSGKRFEIIGMEVLINKNTKAEMPVLYLRGPDPHSVIWADFNEALETGEMGLPGQKFLTR